MEHSPLSVGLTMKCPKCAKGPLFKGALTLKHSCDSCGFDLSASDPGDGPAFMVITLLSFVIVGAAVWLELAYMLDYRIQAAIWIPIILIATPLLLRLTKSLLIAYQYHYKIGFKHDS